MSKAFQFHQSQNVFPSFSYHAKTHNKVRIFQLTRQFLCGNNTEKTLRVPISQTQYPKRSFKVRYPPTCIVNIWPRVMMLDFDGRFYRVSGVF